MTPESSEVFVIQMLRSVDRSGLMAWVDEGAPVDTAERAMHEMGWLRGRLMFHYPGIQTGPMRVIRRTVTVTEEVVGIEPL